MPCPICSKRKGKRYCPAKAAKICTVCCGTEREVTIDCPFDCPYLEESRAREYKGLLDPKDFPYKDVRIDEGFLREHGDALEACGRALLAGALKVPGATDRDARQALEALLQTYKTLESGLYYETRPDSAFARAIVDSVREQVQQIQREETEQAGFQRTRDGDLLRLFVFLYRLALDRDNGRPRGKAFLDFLRLHFRDVEAPQQPSLIVPGL